MNKKLIITEQQYKKLKFFLLESTFDEMAKKVIKNGDTISITTQGKKLNFVVVDNTNGQILMDVSDKNSDYFGRRAFLTFNSFNDNKLELNLASEKQKEENPPQFKTWAKWTLKDVEGINVSRDGKVIDGTNYDPNSEENKKRKSRFIEAIATLGEGDAISIETEGKIGTIILDYINKSNGFVNFELSEKTKNALGNANITGVDISLDESNIEVNENGLLSLSVVTYETQDGNVQKKESKIQNIKNVNVTNSEDSENSEESEDSEESENEGDGKRKSRFIEALATLGEGDVVHLGIAGKNEPIYLDYLNKSNGVVNFELSEKTKNALGNPNITSLDISLDESNIEETKEGNLNVGVITYETKDGNIEKNKTKIQNIRTVNISNAKDSEEEKPEEEEDNEPELDAQKIYDIITGDTQLRNAFYKRPSFWKSFTAELKGEKPKTTGYTVVQNLIDDYISGEGEKRLGKNFIKEKNIKFRPLDNILIRYVENGENKEYRLNKNQEITNMRYIGGKPTDGSKYNLELVNPDIDVIIKEKTQRENTYVCDVIKKYTEKVTDKNGKVKQITKYSEPAKDITIEFIDSLGYRVDK